MMHVKTFEGALVTDIKDNVLVNARESSGKLKSADGNGESANWLSLIEEQSTLITAIQSELSVLQACSVESVELRTLLEESRQELCRAVESQHEAVLKIVAEVVAATSARCEEINAALSVERAASSASMAQVWSEMKAKESRVPHQDISFRTAVVDEVRSIGLDSSEQEQTGCDMHVMHDAEGEFCSSQSPQGKHGRDMLVITAMQKELSILKAEQEQQGNDLQVLGSNVTEHFGNFKAMIDHIGDDIKALHTSPDSQGPEGFELLVDRVSSIEQSQRKQMSVMDALQRRHIDHENLLQEVQEHCSSDVQALRRELGQTQNEAMQELGELVLGELASLRQQVSDHEQLLQKGIA